VNGDGAVWNVFMAQSLAAHSSRPLFTTTQITGTGGVAPIHTGNVSSGGLQPGGSADRSLADLFQVAIGYDGLANISWSADLANPGDALAWFTHQTSGAIAGVPNDGCHSFNGGPVGGTGAKITGGGSLAGTNGAKARFGFNEPQLGGGNLTYIDRGGDVAKFSAGTQTPPTITGSSASWSGTGTWTHGDGSTTQAAFRVTVVDNGSPGTTDHFSVSFGSYSNSGQLTGGNITIH
jgi:hypothetical protein